jgi:formylglycine-generating enzyme required for sulfatase activity
MVSWYDVIKWCNARSEKDGLTPVYYTDGTQSTIYKTGQININIDAVKWTSNGYRLPTECEWEFAARGGNLTHNYTYSGSNTIDDVAWYRNNSGNSTHTVGQKSANELGIYDMSGNVWDWCWDWWGSAYPSGGTTDPKGSSTTQTYRLMRGGCFFVDYESYCRIGARGNYGPNFRVIYFGFRCVQD